MIVSHCGGENVEVAAKAARHCPRVFLDSSRLTETGQRCGLPLGEIAQRLPRSQLVYGSDAAWPVRAQPCIGGDGLLADAELRRICEVNATTLLRSFTAPH